MDQFLKQDVEQLAKMRHECRHVSTQRKHVCAGVQGATACCRRKERKAVSDEENSEMDAEPSPSEEEVPGSLNITDEMKRMLNQL